MAQPDLYYLVLDDKPQGPFTIDQLRSMAWAGKITVKTLFCQEGWENWEELSLISETMFPQKQTPLGIPLPLTPNPTPISSHPLATVHNSPALTTANKPKTAGQIFAIGCLGVFIFFMGIIFLAALSNRGKTDPLYSQKFDAYYTAVEFIKKQFPGAESFSDYRESVIEPDGAVYRVAVRVTGKNAFGGPVRNDFVVELLQSGDKWICQSINRKNNR